MREVRPLRSTAITPLPRYYEPVRLPAAASGALWIPPCRCAVADAPRRVSQDPPLPCRRVPSPLTPDSSMRASARYFRIDDRLQHRRKLGRCHWIHEADVGFAYAGPAPSLSSLVSNSPGHAPDRPVSRVGLPARAGPELHVERAIHMADTSQSARASTVTLAYRRLEDAAWLRQRTTKQPSCRRVVASSCDAEGSEAWPRLTRSRSVRQCCACRPSTALQPAPRHRSARRR
jgi:hypothetical protein